MRSGTLSFLIFAFASLATLAFLAVPFLPSGDDRSAARTKELNRQERQEKPRKAKARKAKATPAESG
jgi:hypothetical protein